MKKLSLVVSVFMLLCSNVGYGMQQQDLKETFFKALDEGDIETVKACVDQDMALVNAKDKDGVYAWQKAGIHEQTSLYDAFRDSTSEMASYILSFSDNVQDKQELEDCKKRTCKQELEGKKFEIFIWLLGGGFDKQLNENIYTTCFPDTKNDVLDREIWKAIWLALTTYSCSKKLDDKILKAFNILAYQCEIDAELRLAVRENDEKEKLIHPELFSATDESDWAIPYEHVLIPELRDFLTWKQNEKNTIQPEDIQKFVRIAFMGKPFLPEFETLLGSISLNDAVQALDKDVMLLAMKTRSHAFGPLFKRMLLSPESRAAAQLNDVFCQSLQEYTTWWNKGARELMQLKSNVAAQHRYEFMRDRKQLCDARVSFN